MNFAFTSIIIFILIAPGFLFRTSYKSSNLSIKDPNRNLINDLTWSILPAIILHTAFIYLIECLTSYKINFKLLGELILSTPSSQKGIQDNFQLIRNFLFPIFIYNTMIMVFALLLGYLIRSIIRKFKLDRRFEFLRFSNKWHYIFTGECLDFPNTPDTFEEITVKIINVLCKVNGQTVIYSGEYFNYYIDSKGDLEAVHLKYPIRRFLEETEYYNIPSRYLVIPYSDIININFRYFNLSEITSISKEEELDIISDN